MTTQDAGVTEPRVRLRLVLALLRIIAGRRGHASVSWHGAGFTYVLGAIREPGDDTAVEFDPDPAAPGVIDTMQRLREHLAHQP
jgi:hypothetical protein